jgi:hypothetical protein
MPAGSNLKSGKKNLQVLSVPPRPVKPRNARLFAFPSASPRARLWWVQAELGPTEHVGSLMPTLDDTIRALQSQFEAIAKIGQGVYSSPSNPYLLEVRAGANKAVLKQLELLLREPPHLITYPKGKLEEFNAGKPYEKSVFIMTRFPEANSAIDEELRHVKDVFRKCVQNQRTS